MDPECGAVVLPTFKSEALCDFFKLLSLREFSVQGYYLILGKADYAFFSKKDGPTNGRRALSLPGQTQNPNAYLPKMSLL